MPSATLRVRVRFLLWCVFIFLSVGGTFIWLWLIRGPRILNSDAILIRGWMLLGMPLLLIFFLLGSTPADAIRLKKGTSAAIVIGVAALFQIAAVLLLSPGLSEDLIRYRFDGGTWLGGRSPYSTTPAQVMKSDPARRPANGVSSRFPDAIDRLIPFAEVATIYPPTVELQFVLDRLIEDQLVSVPETAGNWRATVAVAPPLTLMPVYRCTSALFVIVASALIVLLLQRRGQSAWWAAFFAWNPLVVLECGGMGHSDSLGIVLILLAILAGAQRLSAIALALAVGVKPPIALLTPFFWRMGRTRFAVAFVIALVIVFIPLWPNSKGLHNWLATVRLYSQAWEANGSFYEWMKFYFGQGVGGWQMQAAKDHARLLASACTLFTLALLWWKKSTLATAGYWISLASLLAAPVVYPWYLLWAISFVPLMQRRSRFSGLSVLIWSIMVGTSYLLWHQPAWKLPAAISIAEYAPVYAAMIVELIMLTRQPGVCESAQQG